MDVRSRPAYSIAATIETGEAAKRGTAGGWRS